MHQAPLPVAAKSFGLITVLAAAATVLLSRSTFPPHDEWGWWLAVLPVAVLHPIVVTRGPQSIEVGLESVVIILLSFAAPGHALMLWTAGCALAQATRTAAHRTRTPPLGLEHAAMSVLAGAATVFVVTRCVPHALEPGPWALLAVAAGAVTYLLVDRVLSAVVIASLGRGSIRGSWSPDLAVTLACSGGATLGYLGAVAARTDCWALPLLLVPVGVLIVAARGHRAASRDRSRVAALCAVASRLDRAQTAEEVTAIVLEEGRRALRVERLSVVADPDKHALQASVLTGGAPAWLAPAPRLSAEPFTAHDQQTLDLVALLASDSLRSLALHAQLATHATHDALTGLPNRSGLHRALTAELTPRTTPATAMLLCALDGFRSINSRHGHQAGDQVLKVVAERIRGSIQDGDLVYRIGGDEFVVLVPRTSRDEALVLAERVLAGVRRPIALASGVAEVGLSIGVAVSGSASSADDLLRQADCAMYEAKALGKGRVRLWQPVQNAGVPEPRMGAPTRD